ncbi:neurturin isoform X1 [Hypomesus transpacificus]|uniref:neurturin isoform X1 n=2 Tax=Hypomesus transpacificus TaxID=137520 RepID=UPI001F086ADA|nr:neurturin isoform X1 [Hypomesus transpacificus]
MVGKVVIVGKDGKMWRRQEVSTTQHHLRNWKMILWVVASLLTLAEGGFSEEDSKKTAPELLLSWERNAWRGPHSPQVQELQEKKRAHPSWPRGFDRPSPAEEEGEAYPSRWQRSPPEPASTRPPRRNRKKSKKSSRDCHMEAKKMSVRDLGLGFDSDEIVVFKYCVGTCHSSRKNYDLALKALTDNGSIPSRRVSASPCCRPTRYETVSFMDVQTTWKTIKWLSAANCSCVG